MIRWLIALVLLAASANAQDGRTRFKIGAGDPSNPCDPYGFWINWTTGARFLCVSGTWQATTQAIAASDVTSGTLAVARGGTNGTATPTNGGVAYGTGSAYAFSAAGSAGECLKSAGAASPTWGACAAGGNGKALFAGKSSASLTADISCSPSGYDVCAAASAVNQLPLPFSGTFRNLYMVMATAPGGGSSCKLLLRTGACSTGALADSTLTCTVTGDGSLRTCSDTSNAPSGTAGQCVQLFYDETGTCTGQIMWAFEYTPS